MNDPSCWYGPIDLLLRCGPMFTRDMIREGGGGGFDRFNEEEKPVEIIARSFGF